jgi:hypothetical protein
MAEMAEGEKDAPEEGRTVFELMDGERPVTRISSPRKGVVTILVHDPEDAELIVGVLVRSSNLLSALVAAMAVAQESVEAIPDPPPGDEDAASRAHTEALMEMGAVLGSLHTVIKKLYPRGAGQIVADIDGLRNIMMDGQSVAAEASAVVDKVLGEAGLAAPGGPEFSPPESPPESPAEEAADGALFIPKVPKAVS